MRNDTIEIEVANRRSRRIWYGHGSSRLIDDDARNLSSAKVIDEAMASFSRLDPAAEPVHRSVIADLAVQLKVLDRQRDRLARLLRDVSA